MARRSLETRFVEERGAAGRWSDCGNTDRRASIYNVGPEAAGDALTVFMAEFERPRG